MEKPNRDPPAPADPEKDADGLIPREKVDYGNLSEEGVQAARRLARSLVRYERSKSWLVRLLRWFGITWWHVLGVELRISIWKNSVIRWVRGITDAILRLLGQP